MARTTKRYSLPTPVGTDQADAPTQLAALADAVEAAIGGVDDRTSADTGWITSGFTAASGFSVYNARARIRDGVLYCQYTVQATAVVGGSAISTTAALNWPQAVKDAAAKLGGISGGNAGNWTGGGFSGNSTVTTAGISIGYRTGNPAANQYIAGSIVLPLG